MRARGKVGHRIADNPFHVLGLAPDCSRAEIEREGQKLLGMLELGLSAAKTYDSPLGRFERTPEKVREAMAELRNPDRRLSHELWARLHNRDGRAASTTRAPAAERESRSEDSRRGDPPGPSADAPTWPEALAALGWRRS